MNIIQNGFVKAERKKSKLRLCLTGVSGSGKTYSALRLAKGMGGKIAFIDTEAGSAQLYSDITNFDVLELSAPYSPSRYIESIGQAETAGYDTLIIDSLSHAWAAEGGVLDIVDKLSQSSNSKNSFMSWNKGSKEQNALVDKILASPLHIICCLRSKTAYELVDTGNGRKAPKKFGLAPVQRENLEYEFSAVLDISRDSHLAVVSKNRTTLFKDETPFLITEKIGKDFIKWLDQGVEPEKPASREFLNHEIMDRINNCEDTKSLEGLFRELKQEIITNDDKNNLITICAAKKEKIINKIANEDVPF
jgi:hypothetical protein